MERALEIPRNKAAQSFHGKMRQHMTEEEFKFLRLSLPDDYDDLFKFTFIRNPWDRFVSEYRKHGRRWLKQPFDEWANIMCNIVQLNFDENDFIAETVSCMRELTHWGPQWRFCTNVDFIGRFENLKGDWDYVCDKVGLKNKKLPHIYKSKPRKPYQEFYSDETRELVGKIYAKDIEMFGYSFDE